MLIVEGNVDERFAHARYNFLEEFRETKVKRHERQ